MFSGVVPYYRPCLLAWYLTIGPFCTSTDILTSWVQREEGWLQVWCYSYRGGITLDMSADPMPLSDMPVCAVQLYQTCILGSFIQIHMFVKCFSIQQEIWYVTNPPDMPTGKVWLPRVCKTYQLPAWTPFWIYQFMSDASAASLRCYKDDVCDSRISKISIMHASPWSLPVSGKFSFILLINCNFGGHFVRILILFLYFC